MKATKTFDRRILDRLIQELLQAGLHVTSGEGEFAVLKLRPYRTKGGHATVLIDGKVVNDNYSSPLMTIKIPHL